MGTIGVAANDAVVDIGEEFEHTLRFTHSEGFAVGAPEGLAAGVARR